MAKSMAVNNCGGVGWYLAEGGEDKGEGCSSEV